MPPQRAKGLMWLGVAKIGAESPKEQWIRDTYQSDYAVASEEDRQAAALMLAARAKGPPQPSFISRSVVKTLEFLRPLNIPMLAGSPGPPPPE